MTMYPGHRSTPGCSRSPRTWSTKAINKSANCWSGSVPPAHWQPSNTPGSATNRRLRCHVWNGFSCRIVLEPGPELRARLDWTAHEHRQSRDCVLAGLGYTTAGSGEVAPLLVWLADPLGCSLVPWRARGYFKATQWWWLSIWETIFMRLGKIGGRTSQLRPTRKRPTVISQL